MTVFHVDAGVSLQDLIDTFELSEDLLKNEMSEEHMNEASRILDDHEIVGYELGLTKAEMTAINADARNQELRRMEMLRRWKQKRTRKATYKKLIEALLCCSRADQATDLCKLLARSKYSRNHDYDMQPHNCCKNYRL